MPKTKKEPDAPVEEPVEEPVQVKEEPTSETIEEAVARGKKEATLEYQGIQRTVSAKDTRIRELEEQIASPGKGNKATLEVLKRLAEDDPTALAQLQKAEAELAEEERGNQYKTFRRQEINKVTQRIQQAGLDPDNEVFETVFDALDLSLWDGNFERVDKKLSRILEKSKPIKEEDVEKRIEDARKKWMEETGQLVSDTGGTGGGGKGESFTMVDVKAMSPLDFAKKWPDMKTFFDALAAGEVTK